MYKRQVYAGAGFVIRGCTSGNETEYGCKLHAERELCIRDREEGVYVTSKLEKLMVAGYLYKKSLVWITLLTIVRFSPRLHLLPARGLVLLVYNTLNKPNPRVLDCFNERVALVREQDDALYFDGHTREDVYKRQV